VPPTAPPTQPNAPPAQSARAKRIALPMLRPLSRTLAIALILSLLPAPSVLAAKDKPAAAKPAPVAKGRLYAVVLGPGAAWKKGQPFKGPGLEAHRAYWKKLFDEGRVASAGPLGADTGLAVIRARGQAEADALVAGDPAVRLRLLRSVARPYAPALTSAAVLEG
jgi:uncharacterized protein YciI